MNQIIFFVNDIPKPGGSKRAFFNKYTKKIMVTDACKGSKSWKNSVREALLACVDYKGKLHGALSLEIDFIMPRPKNHYKTGKNAGILKSNAPDYHTVKPDATKLTRSTEDALTGYLYQDDAQIVVQHITKKYGEKPGAMITVRELD